MKRLLLICSIALLSLSGASAGTLITYTATGTLSLLQGPEIGLLPLDGQTFSLSGTLDTSAVPVISNANSSTYGIANPPGITLSLPSLSLSLPVPGTLTINSNLQQLFISLTLFGGLGSGQALVPLPAGTLTGNSPALFNTVNITAPTALGNAGATLSLNALGASPIYGITGTVTAGPAVPEPGSIALVLSGVAILALGRKRFQKS